MSNTAWAPSNSEIPRIILTAGDPAGIGPDIIIDITGHVFNAELTVIADHGLLIDRANLLGINLQLVDCDLTKPAENHQPNRLKLLPIKISNTAGPGLLEKANVGYVLDTITAATRACLRQEFDAMVTAPVNKAIINEAGYPFSGHTEFIADLCGDALPVMMLMNKKLRVALVTTHLPLSKVPDAITSDKLEQVITIVHGDMHLRMGIDHPRLLVCGLNPHAGENGNLGNEENEIIIPVLKKLQSKGLNLIGPVPADTAFTKVSLNEIDAVIVMYHDQGLPVLKSHGFGETINLTLGLPIIRTSVDHGTALEHAGTGRASSSSLQAAIECAIDLSKIKSSTNSLS